MTIEHNITQVTDTIKTYIPRIDFTFVLVLLFVALASIAIMVKQRMESGEPLSRRTLGQIDKAEAVYDECMLRERPQEFCLALIVNIVD